MDLRGVRTYRDLEELIADADVSLVDVCLPPALHASVAIQALQAGKHVFCEKPIALTAHDSGRMVAVAERSRRLLMIGHVLSFFPEYAWALRMIRRGKYGRLLGGHFRRVISDPLWLPDYYDPEKVGGPMLDLHVHDAQFIRLLFGMPRAVFTTGRMRGMVLEHFTTQFLFQDPQLAVTATSGVIRQQGRPFEHGFEIHLERATLAFDFAVIDGAANVLLPLSVFEADGRVHHPVLGSADPMDAFRAELSEVTRAIRRGAAAEALCGQLARDAVILCHKQTQSAASGRVTKI
jgi:predicted dehydrogenase